MDTLKKKIQRLQDVKFIIRDMCESEPTQFFEDLDEVCGAAENVERLEKHAKLTIDLIKRSPRNSILRESRKLTLLKSAQDSLV